MSKVISRPPQFSWREQHEKVGPFRRPWWRQAGMVIEGNKGKWWELHRDSDFAGTWFWWVEIARPSVAAVETPKETP